MKKLLLVLLLCSCATQNYQWVSEKAKPEQWAKDMYECERDTRQTPFGGGILRPMIAADFQERCLMSKGYKKVILSRQDNAATRFGEALQRTPSQTSNAQLQNIQNQQQWQQQQEFMNANKPIHTNCRASGQNISCSSY